VRTIYCMYNRLMTEEELKRMGRPRVDNPASARLPSIRITPDKLEAYKDAAVKKDIKLSEWVRDALDRELNNG